MSATFESKGQFASPNQSPNTNGSAEHEDWSDEISEVDESGPRKRKKTGNQRPLSVSCEKCKERKVKCDRGQPSCGWCLRNNKICEYKERKKPGLRAGYGRELEARLDKQQEVIQRHEAAISQLMNTIQGGQPSPHSEIFRAPSLPGPHIPRPETALYIQKPSTFPLQSSLPSELGGLGPPRTPNISTPHSATFPPNIQQAHSFPGNLPPSNTFMPITQTIAADGMHPSHSPGLSATARDIYEQPNPTLESSSLNIPETRPQSASAHSDEFPQYDLLYKLADLFFKHINTWCPILHRHSTLNRLFQSQLEQEDKILLHAIVATTLRYANDERLTPEVRERQHKISEDKVILYGMKHSSVKSLQALVILSLDLIGDSNGPPGWNMLAVMTRSVVQLGLAVESTSLSVSPIFPSIYTLRAMILPEPQDFIEEESRRRLFWVIYMLDRYATTATAFDYALEDKDIDRKLPCRDDLYNKNEPVENRWFRTTDRADYVGVMDKPENLGSFSYYIEILGILSKIHKFLKQPVDIGALSDVENWQREYRELDRELQSWKYNLPNEYGNMSRVFDPASKNKVVNCGWVMLHAAFQTTLIRLHSSAGYPTTRSPIFTPSYSAAQHCQTAVENISALNSFVCANSMINQLGPPYAWSLWVAARVLLVHGSTIDHRVSPAIKPLVDTLREMGQFWKVADRYANLLQRVLDEYHESERAPGMETPSSVKILADMRRTAFDLDALISRQPRHNAFVGQGTTNGAMASHQRTPVRTPAPTDLEYLDVFDFFNMPRLPPSVGTGVNQDGTQSGQQEALGGAHPGGENGQNGGLGVSEFNIQNFMFDVNADWFKNAA